MRSILDQLSKAVLSAINGTPAQQEFIPCMLNDLVNWENRPGPLTAIAYEWCSVIYENRHCLQDWEGLLLLCLEVGFRHLDPQSRSMVGTWVTGTTHTEHHRGLIDVVFKSQESEAIADLLHVWSAKYAFRESARTLLGSCAGHLVSLHSLMPFSPRLRRLVIRSIEVLGYEGFEKTGVEMFIGLLNHLHVTAEDTDLNFPWASLLLDTIQSSGGTEHLSHWYWEVLVELTAPASPWLKLDFARSLQIITSLIETKQWSKLECWMGTVWMLLPRGADATAERDLDCSMLLLFRQRPGALQKLEQWVEQWGRRRGKDIPKSFKQICKRAHKAAQQNTP